MQQDNRYQQETVEDRMMIDQNQEHTRQEFPSNAHQQQHQQHHRNEQQAPVRVWPPIRSEPIAIAQQPGEEDARMADDSSSDEGEGNDNNNIPALPQTAMVMDGQPPEQPLTHAATRNSSTSDEATTPSSSNTPSGSTNFTNSLPSRLLRAPMLGSLPSGGWTLPDTALPPPMAIAGEPPLTLEEGGYSSRPSDKTTARSFLAAETSAATVAKTSYGSLRDSHMRGRFMDGPSSYRDGRTGDIHRIQNRVRFGGGAASYAGGGGMSIGDRMRAQTQRNKTAAAAAAMIESKRKDREQKRQTGETSTAAAGGASTLSKLMMESSNKNNGERTASESGNVPPQPSAFMLSGGNETNDRPTTSTFYDDDENGQEDGFTDSALPAHALSTSLTGLEILQRGVLNQSHANPTIHNGATTASALLSFDQNRLFEEEQLPRDANGHNAVLARSLSDPTHSQWRTQPQRASQSLRHSPMLPSLTLDSSNNHNSHRNSTDPNRPQGTEQQQQVMFLLPPVNSQQSQQQQQQQPQSLLLAVNSQQSQQRQQQPQSLLSAALSPAEQVAPLSLASHQQHEPPPLAVNASTATTADESEDNPDTEAAFQLDF